LPEIPPTFFSKYEDETAFVKTIEEIDRNSIELLFENGQVAPADRLNKHSQILSYATYLIMFGFLVCLIPLFEDKSKTVLFNLGICCWLGAMIIAIGTLCSYIWACKTTSLEDPTIKLAEYLDRFVVQKNKLSRRTRLVWKRGYQSLWIEIRKVTDD